MEEGLRKMFVGGWTLKWFALVAACRNERNLDCLLIKRVP
jgi:hypothetical protein